LQKDKQDSTKAKKKGNQAQQIPLATDDEIFVYENLPFSACDVVDFYPILKQLDVANKDTLHLMN